MRFSNEKVRLPFLSIIRLTLDISFSHISDKISNRLIPQGINGRVVVFRNTSELLNSAPHLRRVNCLIPVGSNPAGARFS